MPLFAATYRFYAILLASIRGIGSHRRVGAVEIGLTLGDKPQSEHVAPSPPLDVDSAAGQSSIGEPLWNMDAMDFMRYIYEKRSSARTINIF